MPTFARELSSRAEEARWKAAYYDAKGIFFSRDLNNSRVCIHITLVKRRIRAIYIARVERRDRTWQS